MKEHLNESGQKLYDELSKLIPGFDPVLDQMFLTMYVMQLQGKERILKDIEESETEQEKEVLKNILKQEEEGIRESAEALALTPASRRELELLLKRKRK